VPHTAQPHPIIRPVYAAAAENSTQFGSSFASTVTAVTLYAGELGGI
jgi:hypothetical protein